jgi:hypothetical protein
MPATLVVRLAAVVVAAAALAGCGATRVTLTERSALEQLLLVRSIERAVARLDTAPLLGRRVSLELFALTRDQGFAREYVVARLQERGVSFVADPARAEVKLKVFASALGVDRGETFLGVPPFTAPVIAVGIPEISLFKWVRNRGHTEVQAFVYDPRTDAFLTRVPDGVGRAKYDDVTILLVFGFTLTDLDDHPTGVDGR